MPENVSAPLLTPVPLRLNLLLLASVAPDDKLMSNVPPEATVVLLVLPKPLVLAIVKVVPLLTEVAPE